MIVKNFEVIVSLHGEISLEESFQQYWIYCKFNTIVKRLSFKFSSEAEEFINLITNNYDVFYCEKDSMSSVAASGVVISQNYHWFIEYKVYESDSKLELVVKGEESTVNKLVEFFNSYFELKIKNLTATWLYPGNYEIHKKTVKIEQDNTILSEAYPFLSKRGVNLESYYESFRDSSAKVLLMMGERGTGKTSFIRGMLSHLQWNSMLSYDEVLLSKDDVLIRFLDSDANCFIIEDADTFIYKRESGNSVIHKFLNLGDGLISQKGKKLILSTNITSTDNIDSALIRPGRCFDVLQFDKLNPEEARNLIDAGNLDVPIPDHAVSLAELFNKQPTFSIDNMKKKVGFI